MNIKNAISPIASAFIGGVTTYFATNVGPGPIPPASQWGAIAVGAAITGLIAVLHLYMPAPGLPPAKP